LLPWLTKGLPYAPADQTLANSGRTLT